MKRNMHKRLVKDWSHQEYIKFSLAIKRKIFYSEEERNTCLRWYMSRLPQTVRNALFVVLDEKFHVNEFSLRRSIARGKRHHLYDNFQREPTVLPKWFIESKILNE